MQYEYLIIEYTHIKLYWIDAHHLLEMIFEVDQGEVEVLLGGATAMITDTNWNGLISVSFLERVYLIFPVIIIIIWNSKQRRNLCVGCDLLFVVSFFIIQTSDKVYLLLR